MIAPAGACQVSGIYLCCSAAADNQTLPLDMLVDRREQPSAASVADLMYIVAAGSTAALCDAFAAYSEACVDHQIPFVTDRAMNLATATAIKTPSARQQEERYPGCHSCADKGGAARHSSLLPTA